MANDSRAHLAAQGINTNDRPASDYAVEDAPVPPAPTFDPKAMAKDAEAALLTELLPVFEGAAADLQRIVSEIAPSLTSAAINGDKELSDELKLQIKGIGEINSIRANTARAHTIQIASGILLRGLSIGISVATGNLAGAVGKIVTGLGGLGGLSPKAD